MTYPSEFLCDWEKFKGKVFHTGWLIKIFSSLSSSSTETLLSWFISVKDFSLFNSSPDKPNKNNILKFVYVYLLKVSR